MKNNVKKQKFIIIFLLVYILLCGLAFMSAFKYLAPTSFPPSTILAIFSIISLIVAMILYIYARNKLENNNITDFSSQIDNQDDETKQTEISKQQQLQEANARRKRNLEEKKQIESIINQIREGLNYAKNLNDYFERLLRNISEPFKVIQAMAYAYNPQSKKFETKASYAYYSNDTFKQFELGDGLPGQVAKDKKILLIDNVPKDYVRVVSGLGAGSPRFMLIIPILSANETVAVLELAMFEKPVINFDNFSNMINTALGQHINKEINKKTASISQNIEELQNRLKAQQANIQTITNNTNANFTNQTQDKKPENKTTNSQDKINKK